MFCPIVGAIIHRSDGELLESIGMIGWKLFVTALMSLLLVACSSGPIKSVENLDQRLSEMGYESRKSVTRISNYRIHGWRHVTDRAAMISTSPKKHYLITFAITCPELRTANAIAVKTGLSTLTRHDQIIVRSSPGVRRCQIDDLFELVPAESKDS